MQTQPSNKAINAVSSWLKDWQRSICEALVKFEPTASFEHDQWDYHGRGGGCSCVLRDGATFEQAGVNFSHIFGDQLPTAATKNRPHLTGCPFQAMGVSVVIHPNNPFIPTTHANLRLFVAEPKINSNEAHWWFGGGFDLTPYYGITDDCVLWHRHAKAACDTLNENAYDEYKTWCDRYFYLPHRKEQRGIGGIFFDDLFKPGFDPSFSFLQQAGQNFIDAYNSIVSKRHNTPYNEAQKAFQLYRRGRYVEFNLLYDRGTLFGLQSNGRTESILMSLPPQVRWEYNWQPQAESAEAKLTDYYLKPQNWLKMSATTNEIT